MAWTVELEKEARKQLSKIDPQTAKRILSFLFDRVSALENPREIGEALHGEKFGEFWKYRVGDYRLICEIHDQKITVVVLKIGHRREVYRY
jgi:mRNA interferase RelE/StbE